MRVEKVIVKNHYDVNIMKRVYFSFQEYSPKKKRTARPNKNDAFQEDVGIKWSKFSWDFGS